MKSDVFLVVIFLAIGTDLAGVELPRWTIEYRPQSPENLTFEAQVWAEASTMSLSSASESHVVPSTIIQSLWNEDALIVRFRCTDNDIYEPYNRHDEPLYRGDVVEVFIDPIGDARQWYEVQVAPNNATLDLNTVLTAPSPPEEQRLSEDFLHREWWPNLSWDMPGLTTVTRRTENGWEAILCIPSAVLGKREGETQLRAGQGLRINFVRYDYNQANAEGVRQMRQAHWSPIFVGCPHISPRQMGFCTLVKK